VPANKDPVPGSAPGHVASATNAAVGSAPAQAAPANADAARVSAASAATPQPAPAQPEPDSQDAKLAAAAQVRVKSGTEIDSLLDQAFSPQAPQAAKSAPVPAGLPIAPTRDDVIKAMSVLVPAIRGCAQGLSGLATVTLVVRNDGHVESTALNGVPFEGTASGRCMEGVVRRARFPRFTQSSFRVQFPFAIQ
jgi:hypothetical protein